MSSNKDKILFKKGNVQLRVEMRHRIKVCRMSAVTDILCEDGPLATPRTTPSFPGPCTCNIVLSPRDALGSGSCPSSNVITSDLKKIID